MSRLIDADALQSENMRYHDGKRIVLVDVAPTIEERKKGEWIPCSERLPKHELVLVQFSDGDFSLLQFPTVYRRKDMVAWMPLPEPYKED